MTRRSRENNSDRPFPLLFTENELVQHITRDYGMDRGDARRLLDSLSGTGTLLKNPNKQMGYVDSEEYGTFSRNVRFAEEQGGASGSQRRSQLSSMTQITPGNNERRR